MAYDSVRAQLDKLLGPERNGPLTKTATDKPTDYHDPSICKHYLLGFCPNDLHIKHRSEPGSCRRTHSDIAKTAFEKDLAAGHALYEKSRWTRALLSECRAIVADEDRKIRGHARRLQESYNAPGDLSGFMIRTFDTLKKLGMVSQNAKIRVLSEMDDDDGYPAATEEAEQGPENYVNVVSNIKSSDATVPEDDKSSEHSGRKARLGDDDDDDDSDEDLDGFGLIQVIPATAAEGTAATTKLAEANDASYAPADEVKGEVSVSHGSAEKLKDQSIGEGSAAMNIVKVEERKGVEESNVTKSETKSEGFDSESNGGVDVSGKQNQAHCDQEHELHKPVRASSDRDPEKVANGESEKADKSSTEGKEKSTAQEVEKAPEVSLSSEELMNKFYEAGEGPDGLLMLDRKQSLRVCACCGGYISLVDAESRLLSHYGGKSHHSLAQLRSKIPELEREIAAEPNLPIQNAPRGQFRGGADERVPSWTRRSDDRERYRSRSDRYGDRHGGRHADRYRDGHDRYGHSDRYGGRPRRDAGQRGYGTTDWYNNSIGERDGGYRSRGWDDRSRYDHGRNSNRYDGGRKRYRSISPNRSSRRSRRYG